MQHPPTRRPGTRVKRKVRGAEAHIGGVPTLLTGGVGRKRRSVADCSATPKMRLRRRRYRPLVNRKGPMISASIGDVKKHSRASWGEQTIGRARVLKEVLTSTGMPVAALKAASKS